MQYGICPLSIVPIRVLAENNSEMISQLLYGEHFKVLEVRKRWSKIRVAFDATEGWVSNNQIKLISEEDYKNIDAFEAPSLNGDIIAHISSKNGILTPIPLGSIVSICPLLGHSYDGSTMTGKKPKSEIVATALLFLTAPCLAGGKTPFGIDCSGFTQMVYKINGYCLKRDALSQSQQGEALSFIEECESGDLAFFDNNDGVIDHVGIVLPENHIIHAYGCVRIDRIDHTGIFNTEQKLYTHKLRVIKKVL